MPRLRAFCCCIGFIIISICNITACKHEPNKTIDVVDVALPSAESNWSVATDVNIDYSVRSSGYGYTQYYYSRDVVTSDAQNNIYVTGAKAGVPESLVVEKYSVDGIKQWSTNYNQVTSGYGFNIKLDPVGNLYVGGSISTNQGVVLKFDEHGNLLWEYKHVTSGVLWHEVDKSQAKVLLISDIGEIYVLVESFFDGFYHSIFDIVVFDANGNKLRSYEVSNSTKFKEDIEDIEIDSKGNLFKFSTYYSGGPLVSIVRYDPLGNETWMPPANESYFSGISAIKTDNQGNLLVHKSINIAITTYSQQVQKLNAADGSILWQYDLTGPLYFSDTHDSVTLHVDAQNSVYVIYNTDMGGELELITIEKLDATGSFLWKSSSGTREYVKPVGSRRVQIDSKGRIYITEELLVYFDIHFSPLTMQMHTFVFSSDGLLLRIFYDGNARSRWHHIDNLDNLYLLVQTLPTKLTFSITGHPPSFEFSDHHTLIQRKFDTKFIVP